jgi:hypothetical protein
MARRWCTTLRSRGATSSSSATTARPKRGLNATTSTLLGVRDWHNPYYFVLRTELGYMHSRGATLEWA